MAGEVRPTHKLIYALLRKNLVSLNDLHQIVDEICEGRGNYTDRGSVGLVAGALADRLAEREPKVEALKAAVRKAKAAPKGDPVIVVTKDEVKIVKPATTAAARGEK